MSNDGYRNWRAFLDSDDGAVPGIWKRAIVQLALVQHGESDRVDLVEAPNFEDPCQVFDEVCSGKPLPSWWPSKLERVTLKIRATPNGATTDTLGPHAIDPNTKDIGQTIFNNIVMNLLEGVGEFDGSLQIQILRTIDKNPIGGFRGEVLIGGKAKKKKGASPDGRDELFEYLVEKHKEKDAMIERMFNNSSNVISSAAQVVNATRGVNQAPPWMQGDGEGSPLWFTLLNGAMQIGSAVLGKEDPKNAIRKIMQEPVHPMLGGGDSSGQNQRQLPDYGGGNGKKSEPDYGTDQFLDGGEYDGFQVVDDDLLDDGFDEEEEEEEEDSEESDPNSDEDEEEEEEEDDEDEKPKKKKKGNPLDELNPDDVGGAIEDWVDRNMSKHGGKIKAFGARLALKAMKP